MINIDKNSLATRFGKSRNSYEDVTPVQEKMAQSLIEQVKQRLAGRKVLSILELGCGTGRLTRQLIAVFPQAKITAIDISEEMVAHAKNSCSQANYIAADAEKYIHLLENKFDLVVSNAVIQWFENPDVTLGKARELLAPGGYMAMATFANRTFYELSTSFDNAYASNNLSRRDHVVPMRSVEEWLNKIPQAEISDEIIKKSFPNVREFLRSIQEAGAVNSLASRFAIPRNVLRSMSEYYSTYYSAAKSSEIFATYHICYIFCERNSNNS